MLNAIRNRSTLAIWPYPKGILAGQSITGPKLHFDVSWIKLRIAEDSCCKCLKKDTLFGPGDLVPLPHKQTIGLLDYTILFMSFLQNRCAYFQLRA